MEHYCYISPLGGTNSDVVRKSWVVSCLLFCLCLRTMPYLRAVASEWHLMKCNELGNTWKEAVVSKFQAGVATSWETTFCTVAVNVCGCRVCNCLMSSRRRPEFLVTTTRIFEKSMHYYVLRVFAGGLRRTM
jgi:hypothetical protein